MALSFQTGDGGIEVALRRLTVAGWTGRDRAAVEHHIEELASLGVPRPSRTPLFYCVSPSLATQAPEIVVLGAETSGEVEPLLLQAGGTLWLGLASDHTDRALEATSVAHSKQICAKPVSRRLVALERVADRLDTLRMRCWIGSGSARRLYQDATLDAILPLDRLLAESPLSECEAMLCGTFPAIGGIVPSSSYEMDLMDGEDTLASLAYSVRMLEIVR